MLTDQGVYIILLVVFLTTFLLPILFIPLFMYFKIINSPEMQERRERLLPLFITFLFFYGGFLFLKSIPLPSFYIGFMLSALIVVALVLLISFWWKISAHLAALGGFTGSLIAFSLRYSSPVEYFIFGAIFLSGLLGTARLIKEAHTLPQVIAGWLIGFAVSLVLVMMY
ncbi:MAG: hypothetical protein CVU05_11025 [Bacteroidetes bacterium HGW-Bacteroidetes-21]|nr:MAG: hypothetical protein CVU05_11025 [Bacteroidetes bacterium HGW-Bacteroidetes-21]